MDTVNEKPPDRALLFLTVDFLGHGILQQLHGDLHWHDFPIGNVLFDHVAELAVGPVLLGA